MSLPEVILTRVTPPIVQNFQSCEDLDAIILSRVKSDLEAVFLRQGTMLMPSREKTCNILTECAVIGYGFLRSRRLFRFVFYGRFAYSASLHTARGRVYVLAWQARLRAYAAL